MNQQTLIKFSSRTFGSSSRGKSINPTADSRILGSQGSSIPVPFRFLGSANKRRTTPRSRDWKQTLTAIRNFFGSLKCHKTCEEHAVAAVRFALQLLHAWSRECVFFSHQETVWNIHLDHLRSHGLVLQKRWRVQGLHEPMPQPDRFLSGFRAVCFCTMLAPQAPHLLYVQSVCVILGDFSLVRVRFSGHCHGSKKTNSVCVLLAGWMMFEYVGWSKCLGSFQSLRGGWGFENLQPNGPWYCKVPFFLSSFLSLSVRLYISSNQCAGLILSYIQGYLLGLAFYNSALLLFLFSWVFFN
jgi:hypothetical protein